MAIISFDVVVDDLEAVRAQYDFIQVWRSIDETGVSPPYTEVTNDAPTPAVIDGTIAGPWNLTELVLLVSLSGATDISILFSDTDPLDLQRVLTQINTIIPGLATNNAGKVRLTSPLTGTASSILLAGTALTVLGLSSLKANGKSSRLGLTSPTTQYSFRDFDGSLAYWYKTRFYSSKTKAASNFSVPRQGAPKTVIATNYTAKAMVYLADGSGKPLIGRRVIFVPMSAARMDVGSGVIYGALPGIDRLIATTDDSGYAEMQLLRGSTYRVFFEGTSYQRELVVPDVTQFDLLQVLTTQPDVFSIVQSPPIPIRGS